MSTEQIYNLQIIFCMDLKSPGSSRQAKMQPQWKHIFENSPAMKIPDFISRYFLPPPVVLPYTLSSLHHLKRCRKTL